MASLCDASTRFRPCPSLFIDSPVNFSLFFALLNINREMSNTEHRTKSEGIRIRNYYLNHSLQHANIEFFSPP